MRSRERAEIRFGSAPGAKTQPGSGFARNRNGDGGRTITSPPTKSILDR